MDNIKEWTFLRMLELAHNESPAENTGSESLLNHLSCLPVDPVGQGTELKK